MKKLIAFISALTLTASCTGSYVNAADAVPADIGEAAYESIQYMKQSYDLNSDGIITMEELCQVNTLTLDLNDVTGIDWMSGLSRCRYLSLSNGNYTDLSVLKDLPELKTLVLKNVPVEDISFIGTLKKLDTLELRGLPATDISALSKPPLNRCTLSDMPQITEEQRIAVARSAGDIEIECGFFEEAGIRPEGLLETDDVKLVFGDTDVISIGNCKDTISGYYTQVFGKKAGSTEYRLLADGKEIMKGTVTVKDADVLSPELHDTHADAVPCIGHTKDTGYMCLENGVLYTFDDDKVGIYTEGVKEFSTIEHRAQYNIYYHYDFIVKDDGTLTINGKEQEGKYEGTAFGCFWNDKGELYTAFPKSSKEFRVVKIADDFREFLDDGKNFYVSVTGEVMKYKATLDSKDEPLVSTEPTGIMEPKDSLSMMILDKDSTLWKYYSNRPDDPYEKVAENVQKLDYVETDDRTSRYVYYDKEGTIREIGGSREVKLPESSFAERLGYKVKEITPLYHVDGVPSESLHYVITNDDVITFTFGEKHMAVSDAERFLCLSYGDNIENGFAYFLRTDGSIWQYDIAGNTCMEMADAGVPNGAAPAEEIVPGDVNGDGECGAADLVTLHKWLLGEPDAVVGNWKAADLSRDGRLDVFDLCFLRKKLADPLLPTDHDGQA
ncbi:MAG TPA: hypothetical protein DCZ71_08080 [Ruminococcus sp.]|nr:hypothetical protein [Ruminococcus sp.]